MNGVSDQRAHAKHSLECVCARAQMCDCAQISKNFGFITLNDGTFFETLQVVYANKLANFPELAKINVGSAVIVTGELVATPDAKQPFEIQAKEVVVEGASTPDYPLQKKRHTMEYLRTITHLRPRTNTFQAVFLSYLEYRKSTTRAPPHERIFCPLCSHKFLSGSVRAFAVLCSASALPESGRLR